MSKEKITNENMRHQANHFWKTTKRLFSYMKQRRWWMILVFIMAAISALLSAQLPRIMGQITTIIYDGIKKGWSSADHRYLINFNLVYKTIVVLVICYILSAVFRYFQQFIMARVSQHTVYDLRKEIKEKMGRLPISYFDTHSTGDVLSRAINDMDQIANNLNQSLTQIVTSIVQFIAILVTMFFMSGKLTFAILVMIPLNIIIIKYVAPRAQKQFAKRQKDLGMVNDYVEEMYTGQNIIKIYNAEAATEEEMITRSDELNHASWQAEYYAGIMNPLVGSAKNVSYVLIATIGGLEIINGSITIGTVQSFLQYANQFSQPFRQLAQLANTIQITIAAAERVFEILDEEEMKQPEGLPDISKPTYKISFEHVDFGYKPDQLLMEDFNLNVQAGEMVAIVGPTGAGKTTLINLIERFYEVDGGAIRYEGRDIRNMSQQELRKHFSMVLQETWLFNGTIFENLRYGSFEASDSDVMTASKAAHVDDFVASLPDGYETILTEDGTNISQGQRQLLTIARAFLKDPDVLILDEATSNVDTRTEILIQQAMNRLLKGRTSFVVAHRLSTIRDADKIIVMDQGHIIEQGNHEELRAKQGFYANLYEAQFK